MTVAPRSASNTAQYGPGTTRVISSTIMPFSGPLLDHRRVNLALASGLISSLRRLLDQKQAEGSPAFAAPAWVPWSRSDAVAAFDTFDCGDRPSCSEANSPTFTSLRRLTPV